MEKSFHSFARFNRFFCLVYVLMHFDNAHAYIDPGTTSVAFSALGYIFSIAMMGVIFFIRPLKNLLKSVYSKFARKGKASENKE